MTRIVLDIGCADAEYEGHTEESVRALIDRFEPDALYGFDPRLPRARRRVTGTTRVELAPLAAWLHDGTVQFEYSGGRSAVMTGAEEQAKCFDLGRYILGLDECELIVKMDIEGAEYPLLREVRRQGADERISLLLVEWHDVDDEVSAREVLTACLRCPVEEWEPKAVPA